MASLTLQTYNGRPRGRIPDLGNLCPFSYKTGTNKENFKPKKYLQCVYGQLHCIVTLQAFMALPGFVRRGGGQPALPFGQWGLGGDHLVHLYLYPPMLLSNKYLISTTESTDGTRLVLQSQCHSTHMTTDRQLLPANINNCNISSPPAMFKSMAACHKVAVVWL